MATNIDGLGGYNASFNSNINNATLLTPSPILFGAYGNDIVNIDTGLGYSQNIKSGNKAEFEMYMGQLFFQNFANQPRHFNGQRWVTNMAVKMPIARYIKSWRNRLYLGNCRLPSMATDDNFDP